MGLAAQPTHSKLKSEIVKYNEKKGSSPTRSPARTLTQSEFSKLSNFSENFNKIKDLIKFINLFHQIQ